MILFFIIQIFNKIIQVIPPLLGLLQKFSFLQHTQVGINIWEEDCQKQLSPSPLKIIRTS